MLVPEQIDEEQVFPWSAPAGATFDATQVDAVAVERQQAVIKRTGTILNSEHQAGFIVAGWFRRPFWGANDDKTRDVVGVILDVRGDDGQCRGDA